MVVRTHSALVPAVGYLRRSDESQGASIPEQSAAVQQYADERGYRIVRWYTDDAISGDDTRNRGQFLQMLADAQERQDFRAIICWDKARFGRFDSIEYGFYVFPLREAGVALVTVVDGLVDWSAMGGRIVENVMQEGKHQQLIDHSANVARGQLGAAQNGGWIGSPPYAYRIEGPKKAKRLVLDDPGKARVVRRIFEEYVGEKRSLGEIARRLNDDGVLSPRGRLHGWDFDSVRTILGNPNYTGDYHGARTSYGKYHRIESGRVARAGGRRRSRKPESEWIVRRDTHESLVAREVWEAAQARLSEKKTGRAAYTSDTTPYLLSGLLRCGRCGGPLHGMDSRQYLYYKCKIHKHDEQACPGTTVRQDQLLRSIADHLEQEFFSLDGRGLAWMASDEEKRPADAPAHRKLEAADLPQAFAKVKALVAPPRQPAGQRARLAKQLEQVKAQLTKARGNLILLDPENIPDAQERIRQLDAERGALENEIKECRPVPEQDVNAEALEVLRSLYWLTLYFRLAAQGDSPGDEETGDAPEGAVLSGNFAAAVRPYLRKLSGITIHTCISGSGNATRHTFERGEITFTPVRPTGRSVKVTPGWAHSFVITFGPALT
jgi:DNA invertase Pin-like site-specific DNA recombinase